MVNGTILRSSASLFSERIPLGSPGVGTVRNRPDPLQWVLLRRTLNSALCPGCGPEFASLLSIYSISWTWKRMTMHGIASLLFISGIVGPLGGPGKENSRPRFWDSFLLLLFVKDQHDRLFSTSWSPAFWVLGAEDIWQRPMMCYYVQKYPRVPVCIPVLQLGWVVWLVLASEMWAELIEVTSRMALENIPWNHPALFFPAQQQ